ncbi:hypothetical protein H0A36_25725 [Endozoicomonas sp. SM1973]|uniref:Uncharacterized protein n=1 Tax=Spartinivicinus marinus TaxID=2994442 RepID=A0A853I974_9GAMM|nr:hypothetical protein [Spartinivicinus marinus]MCX4030367.1 hypothetical protein [Spartinivicinus marinus]MCX4030463.1 hypothetical protein [Spartinivicinus marinus]NYZ69419.1 hypothetical protein [Spartinivicinus marinus]
MHYLAPLPRPSQPELTIRLREATVKDMLAIADTQPELEEHITTEYLNQLQAPETYSDARQWTGDDRRLAVYWYALHTLPDTQMTLDYTCPSCDKALSYRLDLRDLADSSTTLKAKPYREVVFKGEVLNIKPLTGEALEQLEQFKLILNQLENHSAEYRQKKAELPLSEITYCLDFAEQNVEDEAKKQWLFKLTASEFIQLKQLISEKLTELQHGLPSVMHDGQLQLTTQVPTCDCEVQKNNDGLTLFFPFRDYFQLPDI